MKPRVIVIRAQGKPLLVYREGGLFVASFSWALLEQKLAAGKWKRIAETTLKDRLP